MLLCEKKIKNFKLKSSNREWIIKLFVCGFNTSSNKLNIKTLLGFYIIRYTPIPQLGMYQSVLLDNDKSYKQGLILALLPVDLITICTIITQVKPIV